MRICEALAHLAKQFGVSAVFGIPGSSNPFFQAFHMLDLHPVLAKHEIGAGWMAIGHYLHTKRIALLLCSRGPGIVQALPTIAAAKNDCIPLVILSTFQAEDHGRSRRFQDYSGSAWSVSQFGIAKTVAKTAIQLTRSSQFSEIVSTAWDKAVQHPRGPLYIEVDEGILDEDVTCPDSGNLRIYPREGRSCPKPIPHNSIELSLQMKKPLLLLGAGAKDTLTPHLVDAVATNLGACVVTTLKGKGCVPEERPYYVGVLGRCGTKDTNHLLEECDGVIAVGTSLNEMTIAPMSIERLTSRAGRVIWIAIPCRSYLQSCDALDRFECDAIGFLHTLADRTRGLCRPPWRRATQAPENDSIWHHLSRCTQMHKVYFTESVVQTANTLEINADSEYHAITNSASLGCALPAAIGAAFGEKNRETAFFAITGDGGFHMSAMELMTAANHDIKVICVVLANGTLGPIYRAYCSKCLPQVASTFRNPDFVDLGRAFGLRAWHARNVVDFREYLALALTEPTSGIIAVDWD